MQARHRREQRELVNKCTSMRKNATKSTRKQVNRQIQELEAALSAKQRDEVRSLDDSEDEVTPEELLAQLELESKPKAPEIIEKPSVESQPRRNRQKERLARRQAKMDEMAAEAELEAANQVDFRQLELEGLARKCAELHVTQVDIKSDGHCLFNSFSHQLKSRRGLVVDYLSLRKEAGEYISKNADDFVPFLFNEETGEIEDVNKYVATIENTARWGGELEILALAKCYDCPVSVLQHGQPLHVVNADATGTELKLVYYKHIFGLGEHYGALEDC